MQTVFQIMRDHERYCFAAVGEIYVYVDGRPIVIVSSHGFFVVRPGIACTVANKMNTVAIVHIITRLDN